MARTKRTDITALKGAKDVRVMVRLTADQTTKLDARWEAEGFSTRSAFMRHVMLNAIGENSQTPAMLEAMRSHRKELGAVGRNINQLAFEMNRRKKAGLPVDPAILVKVEDLEAVQAQMDAVALTMKKVLSKAPKTAKPKA